MKHSLSIDDNPLSYTPGGNGELFLEPIDLVVDTLPSAPFSYQVCEFQPFPERHFDSIAGLSGSEELENRSREKGRVHAEVQPIALPDGCVNLPEKVSQERDRCLPIVDVSRAVVHSQDMAGLGEVRSDGIIAGDLPVVRVEPSEGTFHLKSGRDHRSVDVDGESAKRKRANYPSNDLRIDRTERFERARREVLQPSAERSGAGQPVQTAKSMEQNIASEKVDVLQPTTSYHEESQKKTDDRHDTVISANAMTLKMVTNELVQTGGPKIADQEFKTRVGGQVRFRELDSEFSLDRMAQIGFSMSHTMWPFVRVESCLPYLFQTTTEGPFASMNFRNHQNL